jgi:hypothetical protein
MFWAIAIVIVVAMPAFLFYCVKSGRKRQRGGSKDSDEQTDDMVSLESLEDRRVRVFPISPGPRPVPREKQPLDNSNVQENAEKQISNSDEHQYAVLEKRPKKQKKRKTKATAKQEELSKEGVQYSEPAPHQVLKKQNSESKSDDKEVLQTTIPRSIPQKKPRKPKPEMRSRSKSTSEIDLSQSTEVQYAVPEKKKKGLKSEGGSDDQEAPQNTEVQYAIPEKKKKVQKSEIASGVQDTFPTPEVLYSLPIKNVQTTDAKSNRQSESDQTDDKAQKESVPDVIPRNAIVTITDRPIPKKRKENETVGKLEAEYPFPHERKPGKALMPPTDKQKLRHQYENIPSSMQTEEDSSAAFYSLPIVPARKSEDQSSTDKTTAEDQVHNDQDSNEPASGLSMGSKEKHFYVNTGWSQQQGTQTTQPKVNDSVMYAELADPAVVPGRPKAISVRNKEETVEYATIVHNLT